MCAFSIRLLNSCALYLRFFVVSQGVVLPPPASQFTDIAATVERRDAALRSGAQLIHTDHFIPGGTYVYCTCQSFIIDPSIQSIQIV